MKKATSERNADSEKGGVCATNRPGGGDRRLKRQNSRPRGKKINETQFGRVAELHIDENHWGLRGKGNNGGSLEAC